MKRTISLMLVTMLSAASCGGNSGEFYSPITVTSAPRVRRLSVHDYVWTIGRLLRIDISPYRFLEDSLDTGFDNGPASLDVQLEQADDYEVMAWEIAETAVRDHRDRLIGSCAVETDGDAACKQAFFDRFVVRALRRPPTDSERVRFSDLFDQTAAEGGFDEALRATTAAILESPGFLYRTEIGDGQRLDGYELASNLSFFLTGGPPDDELLAAAGAGALATPQSLHAQAARLAATGEARWALRHGLAE